MSGDQRLVVLEGGAFAVEPLFQVVLRAGGGPFEQESLVWEATGSGPGAVAFRGVDEVEIRSGSCVLFSRVEQVTLAVDPVHRGAEAC